MKNYYIALILLVALMACQEGMLPGISVGNPQEVTTEEVSGGLKEALIQGTTKGSVQASKLDGYFKNPKLKIPFPPEVQKVESRLRSLGMNELVDDFVLSMNRAAEDAAGKATPIFVDAIKSMTIADAWNILKGEKNAATQYLRKTTSKPLYEAFHPVVKASLDKVQCTKYYTDVITTYNAIPLVEKVNPDLNQYVTNRAMDGLFLLIEDEERLIRENPIARTTELLRRVFAKQE